MKELTYKKNGQTHTPINFWILSNITLAMYQGNRGQNPTLDFVLKYKETGKRLRTPSHTHWIVDLILKAEFNKSKVKEFVEDWITYYEIINPFNSIEERENYSIQYQKYFTEKYSDSLDNHGSYKIDFLSTLIELFVICEKQTKDAFMFKSLLYLLKEYCEGKKDFYQVVGYSKRV